MAEENKDNELKLSSNSGHHLKVEKNTHCYDFYCDNDSPLGEVYDVLAKMMGNVLHIMNEKQKQSEQKMREQQTVLPVED